jgi:hypothetical protein
MENQHDATVPAESSKKVRGRDFEPEPKTSQIVPDDQAAGGSNSYHVDPGRPHENGKPRN